MQESSTFECCKDEKCNVLREKLEIFGNRGINGIMDDKLVPHYHLRCALIFNNSAAHRQPLLINGITSNG